MITSERVQLQVPADVLLHVEDSVCRVVAADQAQELLLAALWFAAPVRNSDEVLGHLHKNLILAHTFALRRILGKGRALLTAFKPLIEAGYQVAASHISRDGRIDIFEGGLRAVHVCQ